MFFLKDLTHTILLQPQYFGAGIREELKRRVAQEKEGTCDGRFGYIIAVLKVDDVQPGVIQVGTGCAEYLIRYQAVVFRPFVNQVVDGKITQVSKVGFFADVGPLEVFVSTYSMSPDMRFDTSMGAQEFVYPEDHPESASWKIAKDEHVRLRIVGLKPEAQSFSAIGTVKEEGLGRIPYEM
ncbi:RNA polymerase Rpb7 [Hyaloraphidium curvatum]|nr:RNA polymerase Rpb7 [Hyaloraphidium curvatum]